MTHTQWTVIMFAAFTVLYAMMHAQVSRMMRYARVLSHHLDQANVLLIKADRFVTDPDLSRAIFIHIDGLPRELGRFK